MKVTCHGSDVYHAEIGLATRQVNKSTDLWSAKQIHSVLTDFILW